MTDEQIKQRVTQILNILHDPKIGFNGLFNDVKEEYLAELRKKIDRNKEPERYVAERDKLLAGLQTTLKRQKEEKVNEMAVALNPEMAHKSYTEHKFALTGESIMKNRLYVSCGNAAKAFYYVDQHLSDYIPGAQNGLLDTQIMFSTDIEHLIDGSAGHTLPCVKMSDGKYHALDPQIPVNEKNQELPFIQDEIVVGGQINHILPSIAEKGRPYKIMKIVSPQELESTYLSFENFIRDTTEHKGKTAELCNRLVVLLNKLNLGQYRSNTEMAYHLAKETQNSELPLDIVVYQRKTGELTVFPRIELEGKWYDFRMDASWLRLDRHDTDPKSEFSLQAPELTFQQKLSLTEYITAYEQLVAERTAKTQEFINSLDEIIMIANGAHSGVYVDPKKPDEIIKQSKSNNGGSYIAQQKTGYDIIEQIKKSGYATGAQLPTLISISEINGVPSIKEKRISGNTFDRDDMLWKSMDTHQKQNTAKQMAMFLVAMHSTGEIQQPKKSIKTMFDKSKLHSATDIINAYEGAMPQRLANKLLEAEQYLDSIDISDEFHVLTHKDLRVNNLMFDQETGQLSVLDFEMAGIDNVYRDFVAYASASSMPWGFTRLVIDEYNKIQPKKYPLKINPEKVQNMLLYAAMHEYSRNVRPEQNKEISAQEKQKAFEHIVKNINRITGFNISLDQKKLFEQGQNNIADLADKKQQNVAAGSYEHE